MSVADPSPGISDALSGPAAVHIVGTGLIGTSIGLGLSRLGIETTLEDVDAGVLAEAIGLGAGRARGADDPDPTMVIAATPPARVGEVLARAASIWPDATLTDVASVKETTMVDAVERGVAPDRLVGGHPMAGREVSGPAGGRTDLFDDRVWVVCPTEQSQPERVEAVIALAQSLGAVCVTMSPPAHDAAVAVTSHTPQVLASVLAGRLLDAPDEVVSLAGQGLRDMTRIAESDPGLWNEILRWNGDSVRKVLGGVRDDLDELLNDLDRDGDGSGASDGVTRMLARGVDGRARIPGKHGGQGRDYEIVSVMVKDEPGELASLFVAAGDLGVNLEDVRIEHVLGRPSGLIDLSVRPQVAQRLREGLAQGGFDVRA